MDIHMGEKRGDAEARLHTDQNEEQHGTSRMWRVRQSAAEAYHVPECGGKQRIGAHSVDKLHRFRVLEEIDPPGVLDEEITRDERTIHQRPCVIGKTGIEAGNECAEIDLHETEHRQKGRKAPALALMRCFWRMIGKTAQYPHAASKNQAGDRQMRREPVLGHVRAVDQAGRYHPPADKALKTSKRQKTDQWQAQPLLDAPCEPEIGKRQGKDQPDGPRQQTMRPFPPEDGLELVQRHAAIDFLILRNALVKLEFFFPFGNRQGRDGAVDRLPFGDRKTRFGQACCTAHEDETEQREQHDAQPDAQKLSVALLLLQSRFHPFFDRGIRRRQRIGPHS